MHYVSMHRRLSETSKCRDHVLCTRDLVILLRLSFYMSNNIFKFLFDDSLTADVSSKQSNIFRQLFGNPLPTVNPCKPTRGRNSPWPRGSMNSLPEVADAIIEASCQPAKATNTFEPFAHRQQWVSFWRDSRCEIEKLRSELFIMNTSATRRWFFFAVYTGHRRGRG